MDDPLGHDPLERQHCFGAVGVVEQNFAKDFSRQGTSGIQSLRVVDAREQIQQIDQPSKLWGPQFYL